MVRLTRRYRRWFGQFNGNQNGDWRWPEAAAIAVARYESGLAEWDRGRYHAPDDLLKWRPLGEAL